jgi:hypothetical protein
VPDGELLHPELEATVPVLVAEAAHRRLAADPPLQSFATGGIVEADLEDLVLLKGVTGPTIATLVEAVDEDRSGSSSQATLRTLLRHLVIVQVAPTIGVRRHLKTRLTERIKRVLIQPSASDPGGAGVLEDEDGRPVTDYLERFQRVPAPRWISAEQLLVISTQSLWVSTIDFVERTFQ